MIFFGHLGLAAGAFKLYETAASRNEKIKLPKIDYRFVLLGATLPDLIDKPIGAILFINTYHNSRIYAHTLLFTLILIISGVYLLRKQKTSFVFVLGISSFIHLILDSMWDYPETILWPFLNIKAALVAKNNWTKILLRFPYRFDNWLADDMKDFIKDPSPFIFEIAGFIIIAFFFIRLIRNKELNHFFKTGKL